MTIFARPSEWARSAVGTPIGRRASAGAQHYFAFLSYSHRDEATAKWLHDALERFRVPAVLVGRMTEHGPVPRRLTPIFRDLHELSAADDLGTEIREAIGASRFLVVLCSPEAAKSRWTEAEIAEFKRVRPEGCILAAIIAGEPFASDQPGREGEECLPAALRFHYDRRGRRTAKRAEPLAADLRGSDEARRRGLLKLIAGMLGIGLDDLVQRETLRKQRRLALLTAASIAGMVVTSGLAITAIQARDAAREQRREAEGMIGFMLGDLRSKLEPVGRLDALDGVGARVLAYYRKQDKTDLPDESLLQRSRALGLMAQVAYLRGDLGTSAGLYREAMAGTEEAVRRLPDDASRLFDHAQNVFWIGELARRRGQIGQAEAAFRAYGRLAARMVALEPDNLKWRMEVQYAQANLGIVLFGQRRFADAAQQFDQALRTIQALALVDGSDEVIQGSLAESLAWLADARRAEGRLQEAIALRRRQVALLDRLTAGNSDVAFRQRLVPAHQALGILFGSLGEEERSLAHLRMASAAAGQLVAVEPENRLWRGLAASAQLELTKSLLDAGRTGEAAAVASSGCAGSAALRETDPRMAKWQSLATTCATVKARLALAAGDTAQALALATQALAAARAERSGDPVMDRYSVAGSYRLIGDVRQRSGDLPGARAAWSDGLSRLPPGAAERPWEMGERAALLRRLGRNDEAGPLAARLAAIRYQDIP